MPSAKLVDHNRKVGYTRRDSSPLDEGVGDWRLGNSCWHRRLTLAILFLAEHRDERVRTV